MSYIKRAIEEIRALGWPINNESLKKFVEKKKKEGTLNIVSKNDKNVSENRHSKTV